MNFQTNARFVEPKKGYIRNFKPLTSELCNKKRSAVIIVAGRFLLYVIHIRDKFFSYDRVVLTAIR